jgi:serine/threonine-protein kinase RsbW
METQRLNFPSTQENLLIVEKLIDDVCNKYQVDEDYYGNILIAVTEAVNNAINHGNKLNPDKNVDVDCSMNEGSLVFKITDEGPGFDYDTLPDPTDPENLEKLSGRGVFLMKSLADEVSFDDHGRIVELTFNIE